ncbi:hypothetical protein BC1002_4134 [Paraburkholderia atlantica]|uniref:Uncharacterized protein n=2 Tax=Paraburkholderia atlantica TaxID=2654982 RepID=D5WI37_PARAM|nr:hypothetical protein BC1002_4134 [Paraburkholderia atlantica]
MAIALLPLCEGETIGSNLGRYRDFAGLDSTLVLRRRLFGHSCKPDTKLPSGVIHLAEESRDYWGLTAGEIIRGHTEFHYATLTMSESEKAKVFSDMLDQPRGGCVRRSAYGWIGERVAKFRYCEDCLLEWGAKCITPYWMINHQLHGVYFCPMHSRILKVASNKFSGNITDLTVATLKRSDDEEILASASWSERSAGADIARRSAIYSAANEPLPPATRYREWLRDAGFVWPNGKLDHHGVVASLLAHFGPVYCQLAGLSRQRTTIWLRNIADVTKDLESSHPFVSIAVASLLDRRCASPGSFVPAISNSIGFLGAESSTECGETIDVGTKELSCIGVLHRSHDAWKDCMPKGGQWRLVCSCGVSYQASSVLDGGRTDLSVEAYGARYQNHICRMLANGVHAEAVSRELHLPIATVLLLARRAGNVRRGAPSPVELQCMRNRWSIIVQNARPDKRITSAYRVDSRLYRTLRRYDREWFVAFNLTNRTHVPRGRCATSRGGPDKPFGPGKNVSADGNGYYAPQH